MNKAKILFIWSFVLILTFIYGNTSFAASPWDQTGVDPHHNWTIKFNFETDRNTINVDNIYVTTGSDIVKGTKVYQNEDKKSVTVEAPPEGYQPSSTYFLYITGKVKSATGTALKNPIIMEFTTAPENPPKNLPPTIIKEIPKQTINVGDTLKFDLSQYINDPDDPQLTYTTTAGTINGTQWTYTAKEANNLDITITATDSKSQTTSLTFKVMAEEVQQGTLYDAIYQALLDAKPELDVSNFTKSSTEGWATLKKVLIDHPEIYYFTYNGSLFWSSGRFEFKYQYPKSQILEMNKELEQATNSIISNDIRPGMSDFEKVKALHDYVVLNTAYDYENYLNNTIPKSSYTIYGLLVNKTAVCDGYAKTMYYLLNKIGIDSLYVSGTAGGGGHAWNKVKVDGVWYNLDATWDDPVPDSKGYVRYKYFLIPDSELAKDHSWDNSQLPAATDTRYLFMGDMWDFSLNNGYYYYSSLSDNIKLYKIKADGSEKAKIADVRANELVVYRDWIYFCNYSYSGYLFKIKTDGTQLTKLNNFKVKNLELDGSTLQYTDENGENHYSLGLDPE